jgi:hypothetical protein
MKACLAAYGCPSGNEAMSKLKKVKRILELTATVIAVAIVIIERIEKASS